MKLLLTSAGISNKSIANALFKLTGKNAKDTTLVFIPTASNVEIGDKDWLINDLINLKKLNLKSIEITDISAVDETIWKPSLERADIIFFEGGNPYYLMKWIKKTDLDKELTDLLKDKVYVGVSAGSMILSKDLSLQISQKIFKEDLDKDYELDGLKYVDFYVIPHFNSSYFPNLQEDNVRKTLKNMKEKIYVLDDNSAIQINNNTIKIISEGQWFQIN